MNVRLLSENLVTYTVPVGEGSFQAPRTRKFKSYPLKNSGRTRKFVPYPRKFQAVPGNSCRTLYFFAVPNGGYRSAQEPRAFGARPAPTALEVPSSSGKNPPFKILATGMKTPVSDTSNALFGCSNKDELEILGLKKDPDLKITWFMSWDDEFLPEELTNREDLVSCKQSGPSMAGQLLWPMMSSLADFYYLFSLQRSLIEEDADFSADHLEGSCLDSSLQQQLFIILVSVQQQRPQQCSSGPAYNHHWACLG
ncbi:hypothetical protein Bbelb_129700 [Branchiostoma belcheri]|nr:hypothetical protein Bbelb_129700 [Branchiostoma belcheri]